MEADALLGQRGPAVEAVGAALLKLSVVKD